MSDGIGLAWWRSLGGGGYPAVDGDRREAMRLEEGKKGLGWPQIGEENDLGRGSPARGGRWHLWRFLMKGVASPVLGRGREARGGVEECHASVFWGKGGAVQEMQRRGLRWHLCGRRERKKEGASVSRGGATWSRGVVEGPADNSGRRKAGTCSQASGSGSTVPACCVIAQNRLAGGHRRVGLRPLCRGGGGLFRFKYQQIQI
jgi:hypothetical protein